MRITILMFGPAKDLAGAEQITLNMPGKAAVCNLRAALANENPNLDRALPTMRFAVNQTFVSDDHVIDDGDEVALIPPVSGG